MSVEVVLEFLLIYAFALLMILDVGIPPIGSRTLQLVRGVEDILTVIASHNLQLLLYCFEPVIHIHGFY